MKKSLLVLAVFGVFAGVASAQSSVTVFGIIDESVNSVDNGGSTVRQMASNQLSSNRLGFRGTEDLGGGLKAGIWLEAAMTNESGNIGAGNVMFNRDSYVNLLGAWGEVRLGHDYTPAFWNVVFGDVNGANGVGNGTNLLVNNLAGTTWLGSTASTQVRANNMISYFLPGGLGGIYGELSVALPQGVNGNKYGGGRVGYGAGPLDIAVAYSETGTQTSDDYDTFNVGGSYNFGRATVYGYYYNAKWGSAKQNMYELSIGVPVGPGQVRASYGHTTLSGTNDLGKNFNGNSAAMYGVEYIYNLSKMTSLYVSYGRISNSGALADFLVESNGYQATNAVSDAYNVGMKVSF